MSWPSWSGRCWRRAGRGASAGRAGVAQRARRRGGKGRKTVRFRLGRERGRTAVTRGVWWHAYERQGTLATELLDGAVTARGAGIAPAVNRLDVEAVVI